MEGKIERTWENDRWSVTVGFTQERGVYFRAVCLAAASFEVVSIDNRGVKVGGGLSSFAETVHEVAERFRQTQIASPNIDRDTLRRLMAALGFSEEQRGEMWQLLD